jgi:hypothetical protein
MTAGAAANVAAAGASGKAPYAYAIVSAGRQRQRAGGGGAVPPRGGGGGGAVGQTENDTKAIIIRVSS